MTLRILTCSNTSFVVEATKYIFVANVSKISTFNENVLDSKWTLTSHTFRLVTASQQIRVYEASMTNASLLMITTSPRIASKQQLCDRGCNLQWCSARGKSLSSRILEVQLTSPCPCPWTLSP